MNVQMLYHLSQHYLLWDFGPFNFFYQTGGDGNHGDNDGDGDGNYSSTKTSNFEKLEVQVEFIKMTYEVKNSFDIDVGSLIQ